MRTYGTLKHELVRDKKTDALTSMWVIEADPHVVMRIKRVFERINKGDIGEVRLTDTEENCRDLEWFISRYPLKMSEHARMKLSLGARRHVDRILRLEEIIGNRLNPRHFDLSMTPRDYQKVAAELFLAQGYLLLGDTLGLGKTGSAITALSDPSCRPAVWVTLPFLQLQAVEHFKMWCPKLFTHVIRSVKTYPLPTRRDTFGDCGDPELNSQRPDVVIISYNKLSDWAAILAKYGRSLVFDEAHELRRDDSGKYRAAEHLATHIPRKLLMTATPVYNYGGEIYNVLNICKPGCLGSREEFTREWCTSNGDGKLIVRQPKALGTYLRENFLMLRRTREEVGRSLPEVTREIVPVAADNKHLESVAGKATELASKILNRNPLNRQEAFTAGEQLSTLLRQATGIAKALHVAEFVKLVAESDEPIVLMGWHRTVYGIWQQFFQRNDITHTWFTGEETPQEKQKAKEMFLRGDAQVFIMSLRSGLGLDGLQGRCNAIVFGELDWSEGAMEQAIGRIHRDGQQKPVTAYFCISDEGADPLIAEVLQIKRAQGTYIRDPKARGLTEFDAQGRSVTKLAEFYLKKRGLLNVVRAQSA